jgi:prevent-host-death family protein
MQISLTELRRTPGPALVHVRAGEEVVVTEDGVPMCRLVPIKQASRYEDLVRDGTIRLPTDRHEIDEIRNLAKQSWEKASE